jgi:hypothetical protein
MCRSYRATTPKITSPKSNGDKDMGDAHRYSGTELEMFRDAVNWKAYVASVIGPYLHGHVLEVGAGIGTTTSVLCASDRTGPIETWTCLEPDAAFATSLTDSIRQGVLPPLCSVNNGTVDSLSANDRFDTIIYIDVLEHIENDRKELEAAAAHLSLNGRLVVLSPAHQWLFSPFDTAIGHYRRYDRVSLLAAAPRAVQAMDCRYLDCLGALASMGNRLLLRERIPTPAQIWLWDRIMVPLSRVIDPMIGHRFGKTVVAVWTHHEQASPQRRQ